MSRRPLTRTRPDRLNYMGSGTGTPICFSKSNKTGCIRLSAHTLTGKQVDQCKGRITGVRLHLPVGMETTGVVPQTFPPCGRRECSNKTIPWKRCAADAPVRYNITGFDTYVLDWSESRDHASTPMYNSPCPSPPSFSEMVFSAGLWWSDKGYAQTYIWKLAAALDEVKAQPENSHHPKGNVTACVMCSYVLLKGNVTIVKGNDYYNVTCINCQIRNCITRTENQVMVLQQPAFVMMPVNVMEAWYADQGLQVFEEINKALSRQKKSSRVNYCWSNCTYIPYSHCRYHRHCPLSIYTKCTLC
ncbi:uncharacterized protein LOC110348363 [Heterocephalus glaber]|uniref:Uncharacterized protein LOC110348363 n=1 Tax=Heterocephalus glaber TaxID=10181 RepID=A0AAX6SP75_HETGA|nr:uncharacterized protein LOC110348363 [Heterocephalus glaber]